MRQLEQRNFGIILGTGGGQVLNELGFAVGDPINLDVGYRVNDELFAGSVKVYPAVIGDVPVYIADRHSGEGYTPAYDIDHRSNIYALVRELGVKKVLATSLVGGCKTRDDFKIGSLVVVRDSITDHGDTYSLDGVPPYIHGHGLYDDLLSEALLDAAKELEIELLDNGVYLSDGTTTRGLFETRAEMQAALAPAYQQRQIDALANLLRTGLGMTLDVDNYPELIAFLSARERIHDELFPNLVGMNASREASWVRRLSGYQTEETDPKTGARSRRTKYGATYGCIAIISDFPEDEETDHESNVGIAIQRVPLVAKTIARAVAKIEELSNHIA